MSVKVCDAIQAVSGLRRLVEGGGGDESRLRTLDGVRPLVHSWSSPNWKLAMRGRQCLCIVLGFWGIVGATCVYAHSMDI